MEEKYAVIDVETPNGKNDKVCSIGITIIEHDKIKDTYYYLVNPECYFESGNPCDNRVYHSVNSVALR